MCQVHLESVFPCAVFYKRKAFFHQTIKLLIIANGSIFYTRQLRRSCHFWMQRF